MSNKASATGGVKPMNLVGRYAWERERLAGMSAEERAYRKQWLLDQHLSPNEPREVPELYKSLHNPIRRFYRYPLDQFEKIVLAPMFSKSTAHAIRYFTGKTLMGIYGAYLVYYYSKYNSNSWLRPDGWRAVESRKAVVKGDPDYPKLSDRSVGADYASRGFKEVTLNL